MLKQIKPSPFVAHVVYTTAASLATIGSNIFVLRFLAEGFGTEKFGLYSLAGRLMAFLLPFCTLALGQALSRFLPLSSDDKERRDYLLCGVLLGILPNLILLGVGILSARPLSLLIFHDERHQTLLFATLFWSVAFSAYALLDGFYFGSGQIKKANLWQLFLGVAGPFFIAWRFSGTGNVEWVVFLLGLLHCAALLPLGFHVFKAAASKPVWARMRPRFKELWDYVLSRFPVRFVLASFFSLGPFLAPHFGTLRDAGFLMVGQMVFRFAELGSTAFGRVVLPKAGELISSRQHDSLRERIEDIVSFVFQLGLFAALQLILWSDQIILVWLGGQYSEAIPLMQILTLAVPPYLLFIMLASIIDAIDSKPVNLNHLLLSFAAAAILSLAGGKLFSKTGLAWATTLGIAALGFLTVYYLWRVYRIGFQSLKAKRIIFWNLILISAGFILKNGLGAFWDGIRLIGAGTAGELLLTLVYLFVLWRLRPRWIEELEKRLFTVPQAKLKKEELTCPPCHS